MKKLFIILFLILPAIVFARDNYKNNDEWKSTFAIENKVYVVSALKLKQHQIKVVKEVYFNVRSKFFEFWEINYEMCRLNSLNIIIVKNEDELDSRKNFPGEQDYADPPGPRRSIIFGRYYKHTNRLYIVPPILSEYYWRNNFAHELAHYFFDECNVGLSIPEEHEAINIFLTKYKNLFY